MRISHVHIECNQFFNYYFLLMITEEVNLIKRNIYHLQISETFAMLGVFVKRSQNQRYFLRIREASQKEADFHSKNLSKMAKKYKVNKRQISGIRNSQIFVRTTSQNYVILTSRLYGTTTPNITRIEKEKNIPEAKVRDAYKEYKEKEQRRGRFKELKALDKKIEFKKLVSENTRELEKYREELLRKLDLNEQRNDSHTPRRANEYVPQRVVSRARHYK